MNTAPPHAAHPELQLAPRGESEKEKWAFYADIVLATALSVNPGNQTTVLGLRGIDLEGHHHPTKSQEAYDDVFVVLAPDGRAHEFPASTHAGSGKNRSAPDVDHDKVGDVGLIKPGEYQAVPHGTRFGAPSFQLKTLHNSGALPGWRDTNHDGFYSDQEQAASEHRGDAIGSVLIHQDVHFSLGCQTLSHENFAHFLDAVGGPQASFHYVLVDAGATDNRDRG